MKSNENDNIEKITVVFLKYELLPFDDTDDTTILHVVKDRKKHYISVNYGYCNVPTDLTEGTVLLLTGSFRNEISNDFPYYGRRLFDFFDLQIVMPPDESCAVDYISHLGISTIKAQTAKWIVEQTGNDILSFFESHPNLKEIADKINEKHQTSSGKSVTENTLCRLSNKVSDSTKGYAFFKLVYKNGFSYKEAVNLYAMVEQTIHQRFLSAEECLDALRPDATGMRWSIYSYNMDFTATDRLAFDIGYNPYTLERIERLVQQVLQANESKGHTWISFDAVCKNIDNSKHSTPYPQDVIPVDMINDALTRRTDLFRTEQSEDGTLRVYTAEMWKHEQSAAANILRLHGQTRRLAYDESVIAMAEAEIGVSYSPEQKKGFNLIATTGVKLLTGGAGTGKTTTISAMIWAYHKFNPDKKIALCAPTGRAAQRLTELCRKFPDIFADDTKEAMTIHRLLKFSIGGNPFYGPERKLPYDLIIVDEMSMMDTEMSDWMFRAINDGSLVILCGDADQLPSVGAGNVFSDLIHSNIFDTVCLTTNYRQKSKSNILRNATAVNNGKSELLFGNDFNVFLCQNDQKICDKTIEIIRNDLSHSTILSPMHKGDAGLDLINNRMQEIFNSDAIGYTYEKQCFKPGDPVIYNKNNYNLGVVNGDLGKVIAVEHGAITVQFEEKAKPIKITGKALEDITLAYALSIHKSQGSEYDNVILLLPEQSACMLTRNLLYTAITRAKKKLTIITSFGIIEKAIETVKVDERRTSLLSIFSKLNAQQ